MAISEDCASHRQASTAVLYPFCTCFHSTARRKSQRHLVKEREDGISLACTSCKACISTINSMAVLLVHCSETVDVMPYRPYNATSLSTLRS